MSGQCVAIDERATVGGARFLKLADGRGWVFEAKDDTVVFVDDNEVNCAAAAKLGLSTIHFLGDSADCRTELIALGFTELRV